jgi:hypothetical protein
MTEQEKAIVCEALALESHYHCEDSWYTCPQHPDGCANDAEGMDCNCGATERNKKRVEALGIICKEFM